MIFFQFNTQLALKLVLAFMLFTVVGTLSHELGHIVVAKYFGKGTVLHYGSMNSFSKEKLKDAKYIKWKKIRNRNWKKIINNKNFKEKETYLALLKYLKKKYPFNKFQSELITLGGPLQTMLTSFLGLLILGYRKSKMKINFELLDWLGVFLSLFALREVFNFVTALFASIVFHKSGFNGDEFLISGFYGLNEWVFPTIMLFIGGVISFYVFFKVLPLKHRFTFVIAGLIGGVTGFTIWFGGLGALLIP